MKQDKESKKMGKEEKKKRNRRISEWLTSVGTEGEAGGLSRPTVELWWFWNLNRRGL